MKNRFLFLVGTGVLLAMNSCSKGEDDLIVKKGEPATLRLTIKSADLSTKATTTASELATAGEGFDDNITRVVVGLFKTGGETDVIKEGTLDVNDKIEVVGTFGELDDGSRDIVVVANADANFFKGIGTKTAFIGKVMSLTQTKTLLPMYGEETGKLTLIPNTSGSGDGTATVDISRLVARVQLESLKSEFEAGGQYPDATFTANAIFMLNVVDKIKVDGTPTDPLTFSGGLVFNSNTEESELIDAVNKTFPANNTYTTFHYFYAFPNNLSNLTNATRLVIRGIFDPDGAGDTVGSTVYYPVIVNRITNSTPSSPPYNVGIVSNYIYRITATIKNKGVDDPLKIIDPGYLEVTVNITPWNNINPQDVTF